MRAHFPRPETVSLLARRMPGQRGVLAKGLIPGTSRWRVQGRAKRRQSGGGGHKRTRGGGGHRAHLQTNTGGG